MDLTTESVAREMVTEKEREGLESKVRNVKVAYTEEGTFGNYDLAEKMLEALYYNESVYKTAKGKKENTYKANHGNEDYSKINEFQNAHFKIPLYKFPWVTICTICIPLWLMGMINIGIFFQEVGLADRIGSLAALMIAYIALIPVFRSELPPTSSITMVEWLVYIQCLPTIFCFAQSLIIRNQTD